jgi:hypothetical protein
MGEEIAWCDPPAVTSEGRRGAAAPFKAALQARPGEWAQYRPGYPHSASTASNFRVGGYEATVRKRAEGGYDVWVRWPGETS